MSVTATGAATATATAVGVAMTEMAHSLSETYYQAQRIESTTEKVTAFGYAVDRAGGSGEAAKTDLEKFSEKFRVNPAFREALKTLGHLSAEDMKDAQSAYIAYSKFLAPLRTSDPVTYEQRRKFSGQDESTVLAIGRPKFDPAYKEALEDVTGLNDIAVKSVQLNEAWLKTKQHLNTIFDLSSGKWMDIETGMLESFNTFLDEHKALFTKISDSVANVFFDENGKFDATAFGRMVNRAFRDWLHSIDFSMLKNAFVAFANWLTTGWLADKVKAAFGSVGGAVASVGEKLGLVEPVWPVEGDKSRRVDLGSGKTSIMKPDGKREVVDTSSLDKSVSEKPEASLDHVDPALVETINAAAAHMKGYKVKIVSGYSPTHGSSGSAHREGAAVDVQITDPQGNILPNRGAGSNVEGSPHELLARHFYAETLKRHPEKAPSARWGGNFGTSARHPEEPDSMHYDWGGATRPSGHLGPALQDRPPPPEDHSSIELRGIHAKIAALVGHPNTRRQLAMITNERSLNSARQRNRHEGSKTQEIRVTINSTDPNSAAHETARQLAHLQSRTMHDWRKVG